MRSKSLLALAVASSLLTALPIATPSGQRGPASVAAWRARSGSRADRHAVHRERAGLRHRGLGQPGGGRGKLHLHPEREQHHHDPPGETGGVRHRHGADRPVVHARRERRGLRGRSIARRRFPLRRGQLHAPSTASRAIGSSSSTATAASTRSSSPTPTRRSPRSMSVSARCSWAASSRRSRTSRAGDWRPSTPRPAPWMR